jgi:hypothetical protein
MEGSSMTFHTGEWVQGNTARSELIHGFVQSVDLLHDSVEIYVVASDNASVVGTIVELVSRRVKSVPTEIPQHQDSIRSLIDIALLAKDEVWFNELVMKLGSAGAQEKPQRTSMPASTANRISTSL